jgi:streptomycin 3"-adenylyltransferase
MVMLAGAPLLGPPAGQMFDPVPSDDLTRAMLAGIDPLRGDLYSDTRNVLLTFARIWSTLATGVILSKDAAADWVLARLPEEHRPVLARARAIYLGQQPEGWDDLRDRLDAHVEYVVAEIIRLAGESVEGGNLIP